MISNGFNEIKRIAYHDGRPIEKFVEFLEAGCEAIVISGSNGECFWYASIENERRAK